MDDRFVQSELAKVGSGHQRGAPLVDHFGGNSQHVIFMYPQQQL